MSKIENIGKRANLIGGFLLLFSLFIIGKIFHIIIVEGKDLKGQVVKRTAQLKDIEPAKGNIYSADGRLLVTTVPEYEVRLDMMVPGIRKMESVKDSLSKLAFQLERLFEDKTQKEYEKRLFKAYNDSSRFHLLHRKVGFIELEKMKSFTILNKGRFKGGLIYIKKNKRKRPHGWLAHRTLGYVRDYGSVGLESSFDSLISGEAGKQLQKKVMGDWIPVSNEYDKEPINGADLFTTIDVNIQDVAENALHERLLEHDADRGCVVVMEVETGYIKAIANLSKTKEGNYFENYNDAVGRRTDPGSTFKLPALMVALEDRHISISDSVDTENGKKKFYDLTIKDSKEGGYGVINIEEAFAYSSNVALSKVVWNNYKKDPQQYVNGLKRMGLTKPTDVNIAGEPNPFIKDIDHKNWTGVSLPQMSIGYEILQTPLQILSFYNAVANNGTMMKPQLVREIKRENKVVESYDPEIVIKKVASDKTIKQAQKMLEAVVDYGTARSIKNDFFKIAGKTGTAQMLSDGSYKKRKYQASFAGYFPAEKPKYSMIVVVSAPSTNGYYASEVAAPIFKEIAYKLYANYFEFKNNGDNNNKFLDQNLPYSNNGHASSTGYVMNALNIPHEEIENKEWIKTASGEKEVRTYSNSVKESLVPDVKGMNIMDAIFLLENLGLKVELVGELGKVKSQSLVKGQRFHKGEKIILTVS